VATIRIPLWRIRFNAYVDGLTAALGHADRAAPFRSYCLGLLSPGGRKSVEPMAARVAPEGVRAMHQSLHHFVAKADWSDDAVLTAVRTSVLPLIEQRGGPIRGWMIANTGIPKKGKHSVGVARQYSDQLGKKDNCQVAVTLSVANDQASLPIAHRLYLPQSWADDSARRARAGVPDDVVFQTKPQIALAQIRAALEAGVPRAPVLADPEYGVDTVFRDGVTELGLPYVVGILSSTELRPPGTAPLPPKPRSGRGRPSSLGLSNGEQKPISAKQLATSLPKRSWRGMSWREGSNDPITSRFAAVRVRPSHPDDWR
jgi:SRSO17 transposase